MRDKSTRSVDQRVPSLTPFSSLPSCLCILGDSAYRQLRIATVFTQCLRRMVVCRRHLLRALRAALVLQCWARCIASKVRNFTVRLSNPLSSVKEHVLPNHYTV